MRLMIVVLEKQFSDIVLAEFNQQVDVKVTRTDEAHGDLATNVAMILAGKLGQNPREIAEKLVQKINQQEAIKSAEVAGPGFINIRLKDNEIYRQMQWQKNLLEGQKVLLEYSCPNAFKELHTGHLYQTLIGDSMGRVYEFCGADVVRTSFGGDVGLHAGKCMWGILEALGGENVEKLDEVEDRPGFISTAYVLGSKMYDEDENAKNEIDSINKKIYGLFESVDHDSNFAKIYFTTRQWSYDYFDKFYESINAKPFDAYYPESQTMEPGLNIVRSHPEIFTESEGAVVLDESKSGLHTRVFVTSAGLPTYETKDLGVIKLETDQFNYAKRIIMTGNDQSEYMKVVFKAVELVDPVLGAKQNHVTNGTVRFGDGKKMSSRLGNVSKATDVIAGVEEAVSHEDPKTRSDIALGAVKYSMLKSRVGGDIAFDLDQSISTEGNSGPYLQYALVRARSILRKADQVNDTQVIDEFDEHERRLAYKITQMPEVLVETITDFSPHHICTYLYELASVFNQFYENSRVIDDPRSELRLVLVNQYEMTLALGLELLGMPMPETM